MTWTLVGASLDSGNEKSVGAQGFNQRGVFFKSDGTKMFYCDKSNRKVFSYNLSTAWDLTTAAFSTSFGPDANNSAPTGLFFSSDGLRMFMGDNGFPTYVTHYALSTAWDITTASFVRKLAVGSPVAVFFKPDGTRMFVGDTFGTITEYNLSTAWDISTTTTGNTLTGLGQLTGVLFTPDGKRVMALNVSLNRVSQYDLPTAWALASASTATATLDISATSTNGGSIAGSDDPSKKLYVIDVTAEKVFRWSLGSTVTTGWVVGAMSLV